MTSKQTSQVADLLVSRYITATQSAQTTQTRSRGNVPLQPAGDRVVNLHTNIYTVIVTTTHTHSVYLATSLVGWVGVGKEL